MGWRGALRSMGAAAARAERETRRRRRELDAQLRSLDRVQAVRQAEFEVEYFENSIELLTSMHKDCGDEWNWKSIATGPSPAPPVPKNDHEYHAQRMLSIYRPNFWERITGSAVKKRNALEQAVIHGRHSDQEAFRRATQEHAYELMICEENRQIAERILSGETRAYCEAVKETQPFRDIDMLGSSLKFSIPDPRVAHAEIQVNGEKVIPNQIKTLTKTGKVSTKPMPKTRFFEIYQDYVCGSALRVARELCALLPVRVVIVSASAGILNTQTGHIEEKTILSGAFPRDTLARIRWENVDPSDTMSNFLHRMCFKKGKGLFEVEPIRLLEVKV